MEHSQARFAELAIGAPLFPGGALTLDGISPKLLALFVSDRPAIGFFLAGANILPSAAKVVSHGDLLPSVAARMSAGKPPAFSEVLAFLGRISEERSCYTPFDLSPVLPAASPPRAGFCVYGLRNRLTDPHAPSMIHGLSHSLLTVGPRSDHSGALWSGSGNRQNCDQQNTLGLKSESLGRT